MNTYDQILKAMREIYSRCDAQGISLCQRPTSLRLSPQAYVELIMDPRTFNATSFIPGTEGFTMFLGMKWVTDPFLAPGTFQVS